ncbi:hypothetical protein DFH09DRAFT_1484057 [Mycena vulgaris]|nr:hypothetical protein DFH09DRAFT_1484057 [Mycena vulgaris]
MTQLWPRCSCASAACRRRSRTGHSRPPSHSSHPRTRAHLHPEQAPPAPRRLLAPIHVHPPSLPSFLCGPSLKFLLPPIAAAAAPQPGACPRLPRGCAIPWAPGPLFRPKRRYQGHHVPRRVGLRRGSRMVLGLRRFSPAPRQWMCRYAAGCIFHGTLASMRNAPLLSISWRAEMMVVERVRSVVRSRGAPASCIRSVARLGFFVSFLRASCARCTSRGVRPPIFRPYL